MSTLDLSLQHEAEILRVAEDIQRSRLERMGKIKSPADCFKFLLAHLAHHQREVFSTIFLDSQHNIIACEDLFFGTIDGAEVHPRIIVQRALQLNASAVIISHNHPSGNPEPSLADRAVTKKIKAALELLDLRLLDHIIVAGTECTSMARMGWC